MEKYGVTSTGPSIKTADTKKESSMDSLAKKVAKKLRENKSRGNK